jgi:hypothetical protein
MIIQDVPIAYFDDDKDALSYYERMKNKEVWKARNQYILGNFDPLRLGEFFYCLKCKRLEDGAHRRIITKEKGIKTIDVRTGSTCYKNYVKRFYFS